MAEKKINGVTYVAGAVLATEALRLQIRIMQLLGGAVDRLPGIIAGLASNATPETKEKSNQAIIAALTDILAKCDPDATVTLIGDIVALAGVQRPSGSVEKVDLDGHITEHPANLMPLMAFVLMETFGAFFSGLPGNGVPNRQTARR